jgi:ABC-type lipoprotein export system ATPase subunit
VIKGSEPQRDSHERNFPSCENIKKDEHIMEDLTLLIKNIDLTIEKGKFYMVFGDIGSGKSTLLLSMLN